MIRFFYQQLQKWFASGQQSSVFRRPGRAFAIRSFKFVPAILLLILCLSTTGQGVAHTATKQTGTPNCTTYAYELRPSVTLLRNDGTRVLLEAFEMVGGNPNAIDGVKIWQNDLFEGSYYPLPQYYGSEIYITSDSSGQEWVYACSNWTQLV